MIHVFQTLVRNSFPSMENGKYELYECCETHTTMGMFRDHITMYSTIALVERMWNDADKNLYTSFLVVHMNKKTCLI